MEGGAGKRGLPRSAPGKVGATSVRRGRMPWRVRLRRRAGQGRVGGCSARTDGSPDAIASQNPTLPGCGIIPRIALYGIIGLSGLDELSPRDPEACSEIAMLVSCIFDGKEP